MIFSNKDPKEEEDYFESEIPEEQPKPVKQPPLRPDDPKYYDYEDEWEHLRPASRSWKLWVLISAAGVALGVLVALYFRYMTPWSTQEMQYGYVEKIARQGHVFKTFEGVLIPYKAINDTVKPYEGDIVFSVKDDHVAATLRRLHYANLPARVEIERYHAALPWRGESRVMIVKADTADVTKIYPVTSGKKLIPGSDRTRASGVKGE